MIAWLDRLLGRGEPTVVEAGPADAAAFCRLHAASFHRGWSEDEMERLLLDPQVVAHRARLGGRTAGFILSRRAADEAEILSVAVDPTLRGRGIARAMLDLHLRRLAGVLVRSVFLEVDETNAPARRLYAAAGFEEVGRRPGYYVRTSNEASTALVLRCQLA
jgi:[ribosomal protein S18]-alanine N-acetyltransferase